MSDENSPEEDGDHSLPQVMGVPENFGNTSSFVAYLNFLQIRISVSRMNSLRGELGIGYRVGKGGRYRFTKKDVDAVVTYKTGVNLESWMKFHPNGLPVMYGASQAKKGYVGANVMGRKHSDSELVASHLFCVVSRSGAHQSPLGESVIPREYPVVHKGKLLATSSDETASQWDLSEIGIPCRIMKYESLFNAESNYAERKYIDRRPKHSGEPWMYPAKALMICQWVDPMTSLWAICKIPARMGGWSEEWMIPAILNTNSQYRYVVSQYAKDHYPGHWWTIWANSHEVHPTTLERMKQTESEKIKHIVEALGDPNVDE